MRWDGGVGQKSDRSQQRPGWGKPEAELHHTHCRGPPCASALSTRTGSPADAMQSHSFSTTHLPRKRPAPFSSSDCHIQPPLSSPPFVLALPHLMMHPHPCGMPMTPGPAYPLGLATSTAIFSRSVFSCSICSRAALVTRGLRIVPVPRVPVVPPPAAPPRLEPVPRVVPPRPRPRPRLTGPSALQRGQWEIFRVEWGGVVPGAIRRMEGEVRVGDGDFR